MSAEPTYQGVIIGMNAQPATRSVTIDGPSPSRADLVRVRALLVSVDEAALLLGIGNTKAWGLIRSGELPVIRIGARTLVERSAIRAFVKAARSTQKEARSASSQHAPGL